MNWSKLRPLGFALFSKLYSPEMQAIDAWLVKTPNWIDGSTHALGAGTTLLLNGPGLFEVAAPFQADDADITITATKKLHVLLNGQILTDTGALATFNGNVLFNALAKVEATGTFQVKSSGTFEFLLGSHNYVRNGAVLNVDAGGDISVTGGASQATISINDSGKITFYNGSVLSLLLNSYALAAGDWDWSATSVQQLIAGAQLKIFGSGAVIQPDGTLSVGGTAGHGAQIRWLSSNSFATFEDGSHMTSNGATFYYGAGSTIFYTTGIVITDGATRNVSHLINLLPSTGADITYPLDIGRTTSGTLDMNSGHTIEAPHGALGLITWTLGTPSSGKRVRRHLVRFCNSATSDSGGINVQTTGALQIGKLNQGTDTNGVLIVEFSPELARWFVVSGLGNVSIPGDTVYP
jgi:hypothetical protein